MYTANITKSNNTNAHKKILVYKKKEHYNILN